MNPEKYPARTAAAPRTVSKRDRVACDIGASLNSLPAKDGHSKAGLVLGVGQLVRDDQRQAVEGPAVQQSSIERSGGSRARSADKRQAREAPKKADPEREGGPEQGDGGIPLHSGVDCRLVPADRVEAEDHCRRASAHGRSNTVIPRRVHPEEASVDSTSILARSASRLK